MAPHDNHALEELLGEQCRVLTRAQALDHGVSEKKIAGHLRARRWQRVYEGVYATFTGPLPFHNRVWAAVLYAGPDAMASHDTAARLWGFSPDGDAEVGADALVHVTIPSDRRVVEQAGLRIHLSCRAVEARHPAALPPRTTVEETVLDQVASARSLDDALATITRACQRRRTTEPRLLKAAARRKKLRWRTSIERALADADDSRHSVLELRYRWRVEKGHGLPRGRAQRGWRQAGRRRWTDVEYEEYGVRVELDGRVGHIDDGRFRDMRRDNASTVARKATLRYGWADVDERPCQAAAQVATVLAGRGWTELPSPCAPGCVIAKDPRPNRGGDPS